VAKDANGKMGSVAQIRNSRVCADVRARAYNMNFLFTFSGGFGLWVLFRWLKENPQSVALVAFTMMLALVVGIFAFRLLFDLAFPDRAPLRDVSSSED
jgi:hypothetical protein